MRFLLSFLEFHYIQLESIKGDTVFHYQPNNGGAERCPAFQLAVSLIDDRGWRVGVQAHKRNKLSFQLSWNKLQPVWANMCITIFRTDLRS